MKSQTIGQIEEILSSNEEIEESLLKELQLDSRKGVQQALKKWLKRRDLKERETHLFYAMSSYEQKLRLQGYEHIAGVDEVGRGPLAGPVVAAAVILPATFYLPGINDSKKLSESKREQLYECILKEAVAIEVGMVQPEEIDRINIYESTKKAMYSAISGLKKMPDYLLIDAVKLELPYPYEALIKGDEKSISIAAASIVAKVTRDRIMKELAKEYPQYGFSNHMGYGTKEHLHAITQWGITSHHRKSFAPIKDSIKN
ncbi:ribonuclease HII [Cytobacillus spongiae]|jgi:ribonuclease HII|uniref:ribonuclease HII n=1 Tax=Cytobacillus spongiae TaxID=2901381 RepID=UPI001F1BA9D7|nr:ribonuclease HII [Cytobacillus spongiae]UII57395.1 ribonuclease HII [Cytobacillus spongiae]